MKDREGQASFDEAAIEQLWIEEVERRIARVDAGLEELIPAEKVLEELRNRNR
ncbi:MAG: addiction module protein [Desulfococcaceae bacterium]